MRQDQIRQARSQCRTLRDAEFHNHYEDSRNARFELAGSLGFLKHYKLAHLVLVSDNVRGRNTSHCCGGGWRK